MISNKKLITNVIASPNEIFFLYDGRYVWSIRREDDGDYFLWYYPKARSVEEIAQNEGDSWEEIPMVVYKTSEIGTKEARASFAELHSIVKERIFGMEDVLDDIISGPDIPF